MKTGPKLALALAAATLLSAASVGAASADPTPTPTASRTPIAPGISIPGNLQNIPLVQSVLNALGGVTQTTNGNSAFGTITYFRRFNLQLRTAPGVYRQVNLHQGTIINPRATSLATGMTINVTGIAQGDGSLNADSITLH